VDDRGAPLHAAVLELTGIGRGTTVLDLGCGSGGFSRAAADRGAQVTGVDLDPAAVALAAAAVPEGTFLVRSAQDPLRGPFDVVAAVQLLDHVRDPVAVLSRAGRVGAVVAATVWGRESECDLRVLDEAAGTRRGAASLREPAVLRRAAERAGLRVERLEEVEVPVEYADEDELLVAALAASRTGDPAAAEAALLERLEPYRTGGGYRLDNLCRVLVARRA
jgi:SAM-dependent methyltransferase